MRDKLLKNKLLVLLLMLAVSTMMLVTSCGSENSSTEDTGNGQETTDVVTDDTNGNVTFGDITIAYPEGWSIESKTEDKILFSKTANNTPFFYVENNGWVGSTDTFLENEKNAFTDEYQERVELQPQTATYTENGKNLQGFTARYSSEDGTASITRYEFVEVLDDVTYLYVCEYISGGYGDVHEDETTYFEFMDAVGSVSL